MRVFALTPFSFEVIFIKRLISIILLCLVFISVFSFSASAEEITDLNDIFENPVGTGAIGSYDGYYYIHSPFDSINFNAYFRNGSTVKDGFTLGFIDEQIYPYWLFLYDIHGTNLYLLSSNYPFFAKKVNVGTRQYVVLESWHGDGKFKEFIYCKTDYEMTFTDGTHVFVPAGSFRESNMESKSFVYSNDEYDSVLNFRFSSHDISFVSLIDWGSGAFDEDRLQAGSVGEVIFPATPYNPVVKFGGKNDSFGNVDSYEDMLGEMISDIIEGLDFLDTLFQPLFDFFGEFWDEHVVGFLQTFIDNFTYYFKKFAIPDISFFEEHFDSLYYGLSLKFPILSDISDMYASVQLAFQNAGNTPNISFTYEGQQYNLLDLSLFDPVMPWVHSIILVFAYYRFLSGLYKKLPNMI